jgi:hypothetical protein
VTARRSLGLSEAKEERGRPHLHYYIDNRFSRRDGQNRRINVAISVTDRSDEDNSVVRAELAIMYRNKSGVRFTTKVPLAHDDGVLTVPVGIAAHNAISGNVAFEFDVALVHAFTVDEYALMFEDAFGNQHTAKQVLFKDQDDAEDTS